MYLMMLLATFMSAIYGYNLSVRSDYDRDIAKKKAMAVIYKFNHQHAAVVRAIKHGMNVPNIIDVPLACPEGESCYNEQLGVNSSHYDMSFPFPSSTFSGSYIDTSFSNKDSKRVVFYRSKYLQKYPMDVDQGYYPIFLTRNLPSDGFSGCGDPCWVKNYATDSLVLGQSVFDENQMTSRLFCTDSIRPGKKQKVDEYGYPMTDENGNPVMESVPVEPLSECDMSNYEVPWGGDGQEILYSGTCCSMAKKKILVSYMKMDPRWVDRVTGELSIDFWNALMTQPFKNSIGIINWDDDREPTYTDVGGGDPEGNKPGWVFVGKTNYIEAYYHRQENWPNKNFPVSAKSVTRWNLPSYFSVNCNEDEPVEKCNDNGEFGAFIDQWGNEMCTEPQGCLFRISEIY